jgi:isoquinoline 1-oxidoreductase subunit beta
MSQINFEQENAMTTEPNTASGVSRRTFISASAIAGGGLMFDITLSNVAEAAADAKSKAGTLSAFVRIDADGTTTVVSKNPEIGQGIKTAFAQLIAEELDADWSRVKVDQGDFNPAAYGPTQFAGGSLSIPMNYLGMRQAGAAARHMLVAAAAQSWKVPAAECETSAGVVKHTASGRTATYASLASKAATVAPPDVKTLKLKDDKDFKIIGQRIGGVDSPKIVKGEPIFGIDMQLPGMKYAVYEKSPVFGSTIASANLDEIKQLPGVRHAFILKAGPNNAGLPDGISLGLLEGVAIVADSWWQASKAAEKLKIKWNASAITNQSTTAFDKQALELSKAKPFKEIRKDGDVEAGFKAAKQVVEAAYAYPFVSHATLEPQNCTAQFKNGKMEIWAPTQLPARGQAGVAQTLGIKPEDITIHLLRIGGGFGRRLGNDYMVEAAAIAKECGEPVKLVWNRRQDMQHDNYRVGGYHFFKAGLDEKGKITAFTDHFVTFGNMVKDKTGEEKPVLATSGDLGKDVPPARFIENLEFGYSMMPLGVPTGPLRAPGSNALAYAFESFIDELAYSAKQDPLQFRLDMFGEARVLPSPPGGFGPPGPGFDVGRVRTVLETVREKSGWGKRQLPKGTGMGVAFYFSHQGFVAHVVQATVQKNGTPKVDKIWTVADVGRTIVNPSGGENQLQGGAIDGISQALGQKITIDGGRVVQSNFHDYPLLRMFQAPPVEVHFVQSDNNPTGLGEPSLPPVIPAFCNAIFAACGKRVRKLPIDPNELKSA